LKPDFYDAHDKRILADRARVGAALTCPYGCGHTAADALQRNQHALYECPHRFERDGEPVCEVCGRTFDNRLGLANHRRTCASAAVAS